MVMEPVGRAVARAPVVLVATVLVLTGVFGYFMSQTSFESTEEDFNPDSEEAQAAERIDDYFGPNVRTVQVICKDPDDGDMLTQEALLSLVDLTEDVVEPGPGAPDITDTLQPTEHVPTGVQSASDLIASGVLAQQGAVMFGQEMQNTTGFLEQLNQSLGMVSMGLLHMNRSDNESVGCNLTVAEAALAEMVQMIQDMGGNDTSPGNGNNGLGAPNTTVVRQILSGMDDTRIKGSIHAMNTFDRAPLEALVGETVAQREVTEASSDPTSGVVGGPLSSLLGDPDFMAGNYTCGGHPVDHAQLIVDSKAHLLTVQIAVGMITGFEAQPHVFENIMGGLASGLQFILATDYEPRAPLPSSKASLMIVQQNGSMDADRVLEAQYDLEDITKEVEDESGDVIEFGVMGGEILFDKINSSSMESLQTLMSLAVLFIVVILFLVFRSGLDTALTLVALMMVIVWTFGVGVILGYTFNPLTTAVPILLVGLAVDYGIHLSMRYRLEKRTEPLNLATVATVASVGTALLLATITTVFSFMSNVLSDLSVMRQFGILTSVGIISAFFVMNTFVPACRLLYDRRRERLGKRKGGSGSAKREPRRDNALVQFVQLGAHGAAHYSTAIVVVVVVLSAAAFYSISDIESTFDFMDFLPEDLPETRTINYLLDNFNFSSSTSDMLMEGVVDTGPVMTAVSLTHDNLVDVEDVVKAGGRPDARSPMTVVDKYCLDTSPSYVPELGEAFRASDTDGDGIPDRDVGGFLATMYGHPASAGDMAGVLHRSEDGGFDAAIIRVTVQERADNGQLLTKQLNDAVYPLNDLRDDGELDGSIVTGGPVLTYTVISAMNTAGLESVVATIIAAAILLMVTYFAAFRAFTVGLLTTIPIVLVISWVFGSMLLLDIPLNVVTITIAALTVGLGITYAIHISHRFLEDVKKRPWREAMCDTVGHTGAALFGAAATTIGGFGILAFSILPPMAQFGIVTALSIFYSFMASVFVLPSFLAIWARWRFGDDGGGMCDIEDQAASDDTAQDVPGDDAGATGEATGEGEARTTQRDDGPVA